MITQSQVEGILNKMEAVAPLMDTRSAPTQLQNISTQSLNDSGWKWRPRYQYPEVMGMDQKPIRADKLIEQFANDIFPGGGGLNVGINQFAISNLDVLLTDSLFLGYAQYSWLTQNGLLNKMATILSEEMWRKGFSLKGKSDDVEEDRIKELEIELERLDVKPLGEWATFLSFVNGGCMMFPKLKGDELNGERATELFIDSMKIGKGDLEYFGVIDPIWYVPIKWNSTDPFDQWFYKPEFWAVMGQVTHATRLFHFKYNEAPNLLKPMYLFNGMPLIGQNIKYVRNFTIAFDNILLLMQRLNLCVLKTNQEAIISGNTQDTIDASADSLKNRVTIFNTFRNNMGTFVLAKDEEFEQLQISLATLDTLLNQILELVCIIPGIPAVKYFGTAPQGFNATGEFEIKNFYDRISSLQEKIIRPNLIKMIHCAMLNIWGEIDDDITFEFNNLHEPHPLEDANIRLIDGQRDQIYLQAGVLSAEDVQTKLANDPESDYNQLEIEEKDISNIMGGEMIMPEDEDEQDNTTIPDED